MPPRPVKQASFAGGVVSSELYNRTDIDRMAHACRTADNHVINVSGAAVNRQGFEYIASTKDDAAVRLIPFVFNEDQAYAIEFGAGYCRFHRDGASITDPGGTHEGGASGTTFTDLNRSWVTNALAGYTITNTTTVNSAVIVSNTNNTVVTAVIIGNFNDADICTINAPYELSTPYTADDLAKLKFTQANDVMTITHRDHRAAPSKLSRYSDNVWAFSPVQSTTRPVFPPTGITLDSAWGDVDTAHPVRTITWVATSVNTDGVESVASTALPRLDAVQYPDRPRAHMSLTAPTRGDAPDHYNWYRGNDGFYGFVGSSEALTFVDEGYEPDFYDTPPKAFNPFQRTETLGGSSENEGGVITLNPVAGVATKDKAEEAHNDLYQMVVLVALNAWPVLAPGGVAKYWDHAFNLQTNDNGAGWVTQSAEELRVFNPGTLDPPFPTQTVVYNINLDGVDAGWQFRILSIDGTTVIEPILASVVYTTEDAASDGSEVNDYPSVCGYFQQRQVFGNFESNRQRIVTSRTGDFSNFDRSLPSRDDDSIDLTIASGRLDEIRWVLQLEALWMGTPGGIWRMTGEDGKTLTPSAFDIRRTVQYGTSWLDPIAVGSAALYQTDRGRKVREFVDRSSELGAPTSQSGRDLTALHPQLLRNTSVKEWGYAEDPTPILWCVLGDGNLVGFTYSAEHSINAWHTHSTDGTFESICVVPEGNIDAVYVVVNRTINGSTVRYVERFTERWNEADDIEDAVFLDSAIQFDGRNTGATTMAVTGGTTWEAGEQMTITASVASFVAGDVGDRVRITTANGEYRFEITFDASLHATNGLTATVVSAVLLEGEVATADQGSAVTAWAFQRTSFSGATHLEAATVNALGDGHVQKGITVASGIVVLDTHAERVTVGLPYNADLEPLLLQMQGQSNSLRGTSSGIARDAQKLVGPIAVEVNQWRGLEIGTSVATLRPVQERDVSLDYGAQELGGEVISFKPEGGWEKAPRVLIRQSDPLPCAILSVIPEMLGER